MINSLSNKSISWVEILMANSIIAGVTFVIDKLLFNNVLKRKSIIYERIDLIKPEHHEALLSDLESRTGIAIHSYEIGAIDFLRDTAKITIYYRSY